MQKITFDIVGNLPKLSNDEMSQLFHMCKENVDLLLKLMPGHLWLELVKKDPQKALIGMVFVRENPQK